MVNPVPAGFDDGVVSQVKRNQVIAEGKETFLRKSFLFVMLAVVVVCSVTMQGHLDKPLSASTGNLFGERLLLKLCGKKDDPTPPPPPPPPPVDPFKQMPMGNTPGLTVANGATNKYKVTFPSTWQDPAVDATYSSGGVDTFLSFTTTQPPANDQGSDAACHDFGDNDNAMCNIVKTLPQATIVYVWVVSNGAGDTTFNINFY